MFYDEKSEDDCPLAALMNDGHELQKAVEALQEDKKKTSEEKNYEHKTVKVVSTGLATSALINKPPSSDERSDKTFTPSAKTSFNIFNSAASAKVFAVL